LASRSWTDEWQLKIRDPELPQLRLPAHGICLFVWLWALEPRIKFARRVKFHIPPWAHPQWICVIAMAAYFCRPVSSSCECICHCILSGISGESICLPLLEFANILINYYIKVRHYLWLAGFDSKLCFTLHTFPAVRLTLSCLTL